MRGNRILTETTTLFAAICLLLAAPAASHAGISAENVIVVVNADSVVSRTIANHYIHARNIPTGNVVQLKGVPTKLQIGVDEFKSKILSPLLTELNRRRLAAQTRVIAYSADFPTTIDVTSQREGITDEKIKKYQSGYASITGATFFYRLVLGGRNEYFGWGANMYARGKFDRHFLNPFAGETRKQFAKAEADAAADQHQEAAEEFEKLFQKFESMPPLALLAAKSYAKAQQREKAIELVLAAIKAGWWSARYLKDDETLSTLLDDPRISKLLPLLADSPTGMQGPVGFAAHRGWTASGHPIRLDQGGIPYLMSCCLAVVHQRGSTQQQAVDALLRAAKADRTYPNAEFRFGANGDVRATTRFPNVADALLFLQDAGFRTEVFRSNLSGKPGNVAGLMVGKANVDLNSPPWKLVPGAIAENLTSYGGAFNINGHTKITEFLHAGAAISSGTVVEPYALQFKFPLPIMYGYYAAGMSAIEAYYLSVSSPYQLLIVGDPVCQPFAKAPQDWLDIQQDEQTPDKLVIQTRRLELDGPHTQTRSVEYYLGGRFVKEAAPNKNATFNLTGGSGAVAVRAVAVGFDRTEPRLAFTKLIDLQGTLATPTATLKQDRKASQPEIVVSVSCPGADSISIAFYGEILGKIGADEGEIEIDTRKLGGGPLRLLPVSQFGDKRVMGMPLVVGGK